MIIIIIIIVVVPIIIIVWSSFLLLLSLSSSSSSSYYYYYYHYYYYYYYHYYSVNNIPYQCDINCAGHFTLDALASRTVACCYLFCNNPLSEPMMFYYQLDPTECISMKFRLKFKSFPSRKCIWRCCLQKWRPSCLGPNMLNDGQVHDAICHHYP